MNFEGLKSEKLFIHYTVKDKICPFLKGLLHTRGRFFPNFNL